jgi:hypothetical protein
MPSVVYKTSVLAAIDVTYFVQDGLARDQRVFIKI